MNFNRTKKLVAVILVLLFATIAFAQEQQGERREREEDVVRNLDGSYSTTRFDEADRPDDSYLARDHAFTIVPHLQRRNLEYLYKLRILVTNFSDQGWEEEYQKCYEGYKKAMRYYYRRNFIYARLDLELNYQDLRELTRKISEFLKDQLLDMLDDCVDLVLTAHMDETRRSDPEKNTTLLKQQERLRIAYNILDVADRQIIDKHYRESIIQLRMARAFAIRIIEDFASPDELQEVRDKYRVIRADNMNRIWRAAPEKVPVPRD